MPAYKFGDIVLMRFHPAYGQELKKYRPAVIVSTIPNQLDPRFSLIAPFTTKAKPHNKFELLITHSILKKPSLLLCWYLKTIDTQRIVEQLGHLSPKDSQLLKLTLKQLF